MVSDFTRFLVKIAAVLQTLSPVAGDQREIALAVGDHRGFVGFRRLGDRGSSRRLDAGADAVRGKTLRRGHAAVNKGIVIHNSFPPYQKAGGTMTSPVVSSKPKMIFMFWIA